ncbi:hypothetical protein DL764_008532 [Monosporascus ibericus]|uniref:Uncharacterized protein n=1 Tax=Monosporascus ibericus TaxID=155417 RepID=A0A4Q4SZH4_9PEZI|nr:hypothetical protein DL764_008532 [Monosporascus ibericus]
MSQTNPPAGVAREDGTVSLRLERLAQPLHQPRSFRHYQRAVDAVAAEDIAEAPGDHKRDLFGENGRGAHLKLKPETRIDRICADIIGIAEDDLAFDLLWEAGQDVRERLIPFRSFRGRGISGVLFRP